MTRRCSHCSNNGHNSRTCPTRASVRLFGVSLTANKGGAMKKSASMGCLYSSSGSASPGNGAALGDESPGGVRGGDGDGEGYASDDPNRASCSPNCRGERKKGTPWTEEEHRMFLVGLQKLGKGDWRGIARNYVVSRTPTQVASHAQKYFIRQSNATRRKRRSSLFDMVPDKVDQAPVLEEQFPHQSPPVEPENTIKLSDLDLSAEQGISTTKSIVDESITEAEEEILVPCIDFSQIMPAFYPTYIPVPYPFWPSSGSVPMEETPTMEKHEILKPTPVLPKEPTHIDELVRMSKLSLTEANPSRIEPSALSTKLLAPSSSRQSAFHLNPAAANSDLNQSSGNAIHAV